MYPMSSNPGNNAQEQPVGVQPPSAKGKSSGQVGKDTRKKRRAKGRPAAGAKRTNTGQQAAARMAMLGSVPPPQDATQENDF